MDKKKLSIRLTYLIFLILFLNILAHKFYWYTSIWYFDMPMHFLGGLWLGLALIWVFPAQKISFNFILKVIFGVLFIGASWEVFEILVNNLTIQNSFNELDTVSDICFDLAGGFFALFYSIKRIMFVEKSLV